jgi:acetoin utilization protein AcuC
MSIPLTIGYSDLYLNWRLGAGDGSQPTNPIRAKIATDLLLERLGDGVAVVEPVVTEATRNAVESLHDVGYVADVVGQGRCGEWPGENRLNGETALVMFEGTRMLVERILAGEAHVAFNPQGAKHHAHHSRSSGFCVFNDMAWAAKAFAEAGMKPVYLDWDAHAGDGVQHLLIDTDIPTFSIHNGDNFPYDPEMAEPGNRETHTVHDSDRHAYNWALANRAGDDVLVNSVSEALAIASDYSPDVILLAIGADGHHTDPLGALGFDFPGYEKVAAMVADFAKKHSISKVLIGGAGGYQAETHTPEVWARVVETVYRKLNT